MPHSRPRNAESDDSVALFRAHGGQLRLSEALALGLNRYQLYKLRDEGTIEPVSRGLYRLADCFAFRNHLGLDVVLEAIKLYRQHRRPEYDQVLEYARICRVEKVMRPYLEACL